jgi:hypothetical protein
MRGDFSRLRLPREIVAAFPPDATGLFDAFRALMTDELLDLIARCDYEHEVAEHLAALKELRDNGFTGPIGWNPNEVLCLFRWSGEYTGQYGLASLDFHHAVGFCASALAVVPDQVENRTTPGADNIIVLFEVVTELQPRFDRLYAAFLVHNLETLDPWENDFIDCAFALTALSILRDDPAFEVNRERLVSWFLATQAEVVPWFTQDYGWVVLSRIPGQVIGAEDPSADKEPAHSFAQVSGGILNDQWCVLCRQVVDRWGREDNFSCLVAEAGLIHLGKRKRATRLISDVTKNVPELLAQVAVQGLQRKVGEAATRLGAWLMKLGGKEGD